MLPLLQVEEGCNQPRLFIAPPDQNSEEYGGSQRLFTWFCKVGQIEKCISAEEKQQVIIYEGERHWHCSSISPLKHSTDCKIMLHLRKKKERQTETNSSAAMPLCIFTQNKSGGIITLSEDQPRCVISGAKRCFLNNEITSQ